jgi:hypothetical protein
MYGGKAIMYEIAQVIELATGHLPAAAQLNGWAAYENQGGSVESMSEAFVASTMFGNRYNSGVLVNPDAPITFDLAQQIIENALGIAPTSAHVQTWVDTGFSVAQVFQDFALGDQFTSTVGSQVLIGQGMDGNYFIVPFDPGF